MADERGFQRVEAMGGDDDVAFQGRKIGSTDDLAAYLTGKGILRLLTHAKTGCWTSTTSARRSLTATG